MSSLSRLPKLGALAALALVAALLSAGTAAAQYPLTSGTLNVDGGGSTSEPVPPGAPVALAGGGFQPGAKVEIWLHSNPIHITTIAASQAGAIDVNVKIPANAPAGRHTLQARGTAPGGGTLVLKAPVVVAASTAAAERETRTFDKVGDERLGGSDDARGDRAGAGDERTVSGAGDRPTAEPTKATEPKGGALPFTGLPVLGVLLMGIALVAVGGVLSVLTRGRR
jgi:hypothetical protein